MAAGIFYLYRFLDRTVTRPIIIVSNATRQIAAGDLRVHINEEKNDDELGQLLKSSGEMARTLSRFNTFLLTIGSVIDGANSWESNETKTLVNGISFNKSIR